jgi:hypothetical protein
MRLPPSYCVELGADLLTLRRHKGGSTVATFSARGVAMELVERAAWQDYEDSPPSPGRRRRVQIRRRGNLLAALFCRLAPLGRLASTPL